MVGSRESHCSKCVESRNNFGFKKGIKKRFEILTDDMEFIGLVSLSNHSIFGVGVPLTMQSSRAPSV